MPPPVRNWKRCRKRRARTWNWLRGNFGDLDSLLTSAEVPGIDAILFDLGVSSVQIDTPSRGFSFKENGPLDMRMDPGKQTLNAAEIINTYNAADLTRSHPYLFRREVGEPHCRVRRPRAARGAHRDERTAGGRHQGGHPRIGAPGGRASGETDVPGPSDRSRTAELDVLASRFSEAAVRWLNPGGRLRGDQLPFVGRPHRQGRVQLLCEPVHLSTDLPVCVCGKKPILEILTRKPLLPSAAEIERNPRAPQRQAARRAQTMNRCRPSARPAGRARLTTT